MTQAINIGRLSVLADKIKQTSSDEARGPLVVASDIVTVCERWPEYIGETGCKTAAEWLRGLVGAGRGPAFYERRHRAVQRIGEHARRVWHHDAALWAIDRFGDDVTLKRLDRQVQAETREGGGVPLRPLQVKRIARKLGLTKPVAEKRVCARCDEMAKVLRAAGLEVPE